MRLMPRTLGNVLAVVELRTKLVSASTLMLATLYVSWRHAPPRAYSLVLMWLATLAVDMGTTAFNNYFDYWHGTDRFHKVDEPDKVVARAEVEPGFAFWVAFWCFAAAIILGLLIALAGKPWVIPAGAACMLVGFLYTGGPIPISRTPFGELVAGTCLGPALFAIACGVWSLPLDAGVLIAALPSCLWIAAILAVNNTCDIEGDRLAGRRTWAVITGRRTGERTVMLLGLGAQITGILAGLHGYLPRLAWLTMTAGSLPIALVMISMHRRGFSHATKGPNMRRILLCLLLATASLACGYIS